MQLGRIADIFTAIVGVALAYVIVSSSNTAGIINAWGGAFAGSVKAAEGH